ncbi:MAG: glycosyltransferase family 4 protein [Saprospiraceae bacterium]|nr:glycosyltransferase family 4 protein [Saprospiraceae bacterium]
MSHDIKLLTLISYKFLPAKLGGHLSHVYFHNAVSTYLESIIAGRIENDPSSEKNLRFELIPVFRSQLGTYFPFSHSLDLVSIIRKRKINALMCSHPYLGPTGWLASRITHIPMVSYSHNIESERFRSMGRKWWRLMHHFEKWVMRKSAINFFVTEEDMIWAIDHYGLSPKACFVSPFGINLDKIPEKNTNAKNNWVKKGVIEPQDKLLYFVGSYDYQPNEQAVIDILHEVLPRLSKTNMAYKILIVGKGLSNVLKKEIEETTGKVVYVGFVEDIRDVLDAADVMLNPMSLGGGIKTKAVEALGNNIRVVSTEDGSKGLLQEVCGKMLLVSKDGDWDTFTQNIVLAASDKENIPDSFYAQYSWSGVTEKASQEIKKIILK